MVSKQAFTAKLRGLITTLSHHVSTDDGQWAIKGFIDAFKHIYTISSDTKVISNIQFFVAEKWKIASDKRGSGNTANIGSIQSIDDIVSERGMFANLGESWFDDYWMNYGKIIIKNKNGGTKRITSLEESVKYRGGDTSLIVPRNNSR